ncbi:CerR family C-terminal domain-containing protein [Xylophilus sp.]|uniref:CerR family C-terminal domain-containing protein n=1 Tax=Xylophilus sp. TaxID=2653893 RepID=UPI0013BC321F|nr:CerR family C-terminal domain-containing protein [Xylophilus sp.]KAF1048198.1 MAG: HTH-type transcriptional regulator MtrR [Xylophilus sp.]
MPAPPAASAPPRCPSLLHADRTDPRSRLLLAALRLFSEQGFARTSTRDLAQAAGVNLAAIRYYFGDKEGLYRATFTEAVGSLSELVPLFTPPALSLRAALAAYFGGFTTLFKQAEGATLARQYMRLYMREALDPTTFWAEEIEHDQVGPHQALVGVLRRHLRLEADDDALHRLAFSFAGLACSLLLQQQLIGRLRPGLLDTPEAVDAWTAQLVDGGAALVAAERRRRVAAARARPLRPPRRSTRSTAHDAA